VGISADENRARKGSTDWAAPNLVLTCGRGSHTTEFTVCSSRGAGLASEGSGRSIPSRGEAKDQSYWEKVLKQAGHIRRGQSATASRVAVSPRADNACGRGGGRQRACGNGSTGISISPAGVGIDNLHSKTGATGWRIGNFLGARSSNGGKQDVPVLPRRSVARFQDTIFAVFAPRMSLLSRTFRLLGLFAFLPLEELGSGIYNGK